MPFQIQFSSSSYQYVIHPHLQQTTGPDKKKLKNNLLRFFSSDGDRTPQEDIHSDDNHNNFQFIPYALIMMMMMMWSSSRLVCLC